MTLHMAARPCSTCPYRRDTPPGIWSADEYRKLPQYDDAYQPVPALAVFRCHQQNGTGVPTVCRGWLAVHPDSPAVRLAILTGELTRAQRDTPVDVALYDSGQEACLAGLAAIARPSTKALRAQARLLRRGYAKEDIP